MGHRFIWLAGPAMALAGASAYPSQARACSPPPPQESDPCDSLWLYAPAPEFPVNLETLIRIQGASWDRYGRVYLGPYEGYLDVPFALERQGDAGWESVEYMLVDEPNLVEGAKHVELADPQPGQYRVVWSESTCAFEPEVESGAGRLVGTFTMTPEVPWPTSLGELEARWVVEDVELYIGEEGDCTPIIYEATLGTVELSLPFEPEWMPWADSLGIATYVDGELERGFAAVTTEQAAAGVFTTQISMVCSTEDPGVHELFSWGPASGSHTVELVARVDGHDDVFSSAVEYTVQCPPGEVDMGGSGGDEGGATQGSDAGAGEASEGQGCRVAGRAPPVLSWLWIAAWGCWRRAARRSCG